MASQVANLLASAIGTVGKPAQPSAAKAVVDDQFARLLDEQPPAPSRSETTAPRSATPANPESKPAADDATPRDTSDAAEATETAATAPAEAASSTTEDDDTDSTTTSLADSLLAALAALGLVAETPATGETAALDGKALKDIEGSLEELSNLLGVDMKTLMQQLATLAKGVAAEGGGEGDLLAKLNAFVTDKLAATGKLPDAKVEASLAKLVSGLGEFAKQIPTEPELASAQLKLPEPVLAAKPAASTETLKNAEPQLKVEPASLERKAEVDKPVDQTEGQNKAPANTAQQATRPANGNENTSNPTPVTQAATATAPTAQVDASAAPRVVQTGYQTNQQQLNLPQLAFEMSRQVSDGNTRFQIRLDPAELGRIDVKLDIDSNGQVNARLTVEKAETLDLMQRDQRALEKALQQAGLDQSKTNLEFSLKQNPFAGDQNQHGGNGQGELSGGQDGQEETEISAPAITLYRGALQASGVNIIA